MKISSLLINAETYTHHAHGPGDGTKNSAPAHTHTETDGFVTSPPYCALLLSPLSSAT